MKANVGIDLVFLLQRHAFVLAPPVNGFLMLLQRKLEDSTETASKLAEVLKKRMSELSSSIYCLSRALGLSIRHLAFKLHGC